MDLRTTQHPPVPSSRPATAGPAPTSAPRRRTSRSPTKTAANDSRHKKRSPNYVHTQAASPAVISSLIDQLSAISIPAHDHFENLLVGYEDGPTASRNTSVHSASRKNSVSGRDGSSLDQPSFNTSMREQNDDFPDDACEPPVIRISKPPSGFSSVTAPKKKDNKHALSNYLGRKSSSQASVHSNHSVHSTASIGNISIEPGLPNVPGASSERSSAESKRSAKGHRGLMYMGSRERLRMKETDKKRHPGQSSEEYVLHDSPRKAVVPLFPYEDTIKEEPTSVEDDKPFPAESSRFAQRFMDRSASPRRLRINLVDGPAEGGSGSPRSPGPIPERGSSLKHTGSPPRRSKKHRTKDTKRTESPKPVTVPEEVVEMDEESARKEKLLQELEQEETEVARRIRVLKEQKLRRHILAGEQPMRVDAGGTPPGEPEVSVISSPEASPTSTVSSTSEVRVRNTTKAHKVLGITDEQFAVHKPEEQLAEMAETRHLKPESAAITQNRNLRHSRTRSLTVNDGDDLTPLPINYALALQSAEAASPPTPLMGSFVRKSSPQPSSISASSSKEASVPSIKRSNSALAVGGRSAVGRKATTSTFMATSKGHAHSSSETDGFSIPRTASFRSASEEVGNRHQSMILPSSASASNSAQLQRTRTLSKKRWSHPDLPAKAEKAHNEKMMKKEAAALGGVQNLPQTVIEERTASLDAIDLEVESYLNQPRLSQKIRHPQTGRIISFSDVGDPNGFVVFVCVGMGLTRYVMAFYDQLAATLKLRLITPERPGIGQSQVDPTGTPMSWPGECLQYIDCPTD